MIRVFRCHLRYVTALHASRISENLHRADLAAQERAEHIAGWIRLTEEKLKQTEEASAQVAPKLPRKGVGQGIGGGRPEGGINAAVRERDIERTEAQRAVKIDKLSPGQAGSEGDRYGRQAGGSPEGCQGDSELKKLSL